MLTEGLKDTGVIAARSLQHTEIRVRLAALRTLEVLDAKELASQFARALVGARTQTRPRTRWRHPGSA